MTAGVFYYIPVTIDLSMQLGKPIFIFSWPIKKAPLEIPKALFILSNDLPRPPCRA